MSVEGLIKKDASALLQRIKQDQKQHKHLRRHTRHSSFILSVMTILDRSVPLDGVVTEISGGGVLFRPASNYILDRKGERVMISIGDFQASGKIVAVRPNGYGVKLLSELTEEQVVDLIEEYSVSEDA